MEIETTTLVCETKDKLDKLVEEFIENGWQTDGETVVSGSNLNGYCYGRYMWRKKEAEDE